MHLRDLVDVGRAMSRSIALAPCLSAVDLTAAPSAALQIGAAMPSETRGERKGLQASNPIGKNSTTYATQRSVGLIDN